MLFETKVLDPWGEWKSMGDLGEADSQWMLTFFQHAVTYNPRLRITSVVQDGVEVTVVRSIALSGVEVERNTCVFDTEGEAQEFARGCQGLCVADLSIALRGLCPV